MSETNLISNYHCIGKRRYLICFYSKISVVILAVVGVFALASFQVGWLTFDLSGSARQPNDLQEHKTIINVVGQSGYFSDFIPVDPSKIYRLSGFFRTQSDNLGSAAASRIYFGVRIYDKNRRAITGGLGAYRYPAGNGILLTGLEGWVKLEGDITSESNKAQNSFSQDTAWVRIVVVPSYGTTDVQTEIADVEFSERIQSLISD